MNTTLISAIVRQTTVLIAALATASGQRSQLAALANQVFADLVRELREQGLGNKVIADMFGMALRTYHRRLARLAVSRSDHGRSLWEAVFTHIQQHGPLARTALLSRFAREDEATLHAILLDLIESGLVSREGDEDSVALRAAESGSGNATESSGALLDAMLRVALHRHGPASIDTLLEIVPAPRDTVEAALVTLTAEGLVLRNDAGQAPMFACETCVIAFGNDAGWEAAVFDHYQAMVSSIVTKLRAGARRAALADSIGGSTFVFDVWDGHPLQSEVLGYLRDMRERGIALRKMLEEHDARAAMPASAKAIRVTSYVGQSVTEEGDDDA